MTNVKNVYDNPINIDAIAQRVYDLGELFHSIPEDTDWNDIVKTFEDAGYTARIDNCEFTCAIWRKDGEQRVTWTYCGGWNDQGAQGGEQRFISFKLSRGTLHYMGKYLAVRVI